STGHHSNPHQGIPTTTTSGAMSGTSMELVSRLWSLHAVIMATRICMHTSTRLWHSVSNITFTRRWRRPVSHPNQASTEIPERMKSTPLMLYSLLLRMNGMLRLPLIASLEIHW
ncbi:hypothetical protein BGZ52_009395, partial [Haplosporangium bisporale]